MGGTSCRLPRSFLFTLFLFLSLCLLASLTQATNPAYEAPSFEQVRKWTHQQVMEWLKYQGQWTKQYEAIFAEHQMNGKLLLHMDDQKLAALGVSSTVHRSFLLDQLAEIRQQRTSNHQTPTRTTNESQNNADQVPSVKAPVPPKKPTPLPPSFSSFGLLSDDTHSNQNISNFWTFRKAHPYKTSVLATALHNSPRLTILYAYFFEYDELLRPLFKTEGTTIKFWAMWLFAPHLQTAFYSLQFSSMHSYLVFVFCFNAVLQTIAEINALVFRNNLSNWFISCSAPLLTLVAFPIIPWFICDFFFYAYLAAVISLAITSYLIKLYNINAHLFALKSN